MLKKIVLQPGIQKEGTQYSAEGAWFDCDKVRFRQGRPEKIGGWERASSNTFLGVARKLHNWSSINKDDYLAIGTNKKVYVELGGVCFDITPKRYKLTTSLKPNSSVPTTVTEPVISSSATTLYSVDALTAGSIIRINNEYILVGAVNSGVTPPEASSLTRAKYGTTAVGHDSGDAIFEIPKVENPIGIVNGTSTVLIHDNNHGAFSGDYVTFLEIETDPDATSGVGGITRDTLLTVTGNNETGYYKPTSTQGWEIKKILNSDYYEIDVGTSGTVDGSTTLNGAISASASEIIVTDGGSIDANDIVKIDDEYIKLVSKSTHTFTNCLRGQFGSSQASHSDDASVQLVGTSTSPAFLGDDCYILYDAHAATTGYAAGSGWSAGRWNGRPDIFYDSTINESGGISNSENDITLNSVAGFESSGTALVGGGEEGSELVTYASISTLTLITVARGQLGTIAKAHANGTTVYSVTSDWLAWGQAETSESSDALRVWSIDNFGEDLILAPKDGIPYYWNKSFRTDGSLPTSIVDSTNGVNSGILIGSAVPLSSMGVSPTIIDPGGDIGHGEVPDQVRILMTHPTQPCIVAFGCTDTFGSFDPMLVRWSDVIDPATLAGPGSWAVEGSNLAGGTPLQTGSEIIAAARSKREILIWTDEAAYTMRYTGGNTIFAIEEVASGVSIASMDAFGVAGDRVYWMGDRNFYVYTGSVTLLPCSVVNYVFEDPVYGLNYSKREKIFAARNTSFGEITWFYPSGESGSVNRYVTYNYIEDSWAVGSMSRTAWSDSGIRQFPQAAAPLNETQENSRLYIHEKGSDDDGSPMTAYIESGFVDIDDGDHFSFVSRIIPDVRYARGGETGMNIDITPKDYPSSGASSGTTIQTSVTSSSTESQIRLRGRQLALKFTSTGQGVGWTLGDTRVSIKPDGRR
jgi:hypothetical protein